MASAQAKATRTLQKIPPRELPLTDLEGSLEGFRLALDRQLASCRASNPETSFDFDGRAVPLREWCTRTAERFVVLTAISSSFDELMAKARDEFDWYRSTGAPTTGEVKFTGYYFPGLEGRLQRDAEFAYPLYAKPADLVEAVEDGQTVWRRKLPDGSLVPYYTREEIDLGGALRDRGLEIAWVKDPLEAFIFHVQGAGAIHLTEADGTRSRKVLNYAGKNGRPYVSLRRILSDQGVAEEFLTLQGMRRYFALYPEKLMPSLAKSPGYVFFEESIEGPYGVKDVILTPGHSIAIDPSALPMGGVALVRTQRPLQDPLSSIPQVSSWKDFSRLALAQDTGGAIRTAGRVDFYWGDDAYAEFAAGQMNQSGSIFFALVR